MNQTNLLISVDALQAIHDHVHHARAKHPGFKATTYGKAWVLLEEVGELLWALAFQSRKRVKEEAMDVVAVCVRIFEGE